MKRPFQWIVAFAGWSLAIAIPLVWNEAAGGALAAWSRGTLGLEPSYAIAALAALCLAGMLATGLVFDVQARRRAWSEWRREFRYAGPARGIDLHAVVAGIRPMGQEYVPAPRALRRPPQDSAGNSVPAEISDNAVRYIDGVLEQGRLGVLLQGRSLVGKTRFVAEWLRSSQSDMFVVVPDPSRPAPAPPTALRRHVGGGCCVWLDDLEQHANNIPQLLAELDGYRKATESRGASFLVLATVRDGAPSLAVDSDSAFLILREGLDRVELAPPAPEHLDAVASAADVKSPDFGPSERSFAFLLDREFEVQRARYRALEEGSSTDRAAVRLLQAARVLDERLVDIDPDGLRRAVSALFDVNPEVARAGMGVLRRNGFAEGDALEPAYLVHVVPDPLYDDLHLASRLEAHFCAEREAGGLVNWAVGLGFEEEYEWALHLLQLAVDIGKETGTPEALAACATARLNGGNYVLWQSEDPSDEQALQRARGFWDEAEQFGDDCGSESGHFVASVAAFDRANSYRWGDDLVEAEAGYRHVVDREAAGCDGPEPTDRGLTIAARAAGNLGVLLSKSEGREEEAQPWLLRAAEWGRRAETPMGLETAARAELTLSGTEADPATWLVRAGEAGDLSGTPGGSELAAQAITDLAPYVLADMGLEAALGAYEGAAMFGKIAGTPRGAGLAAEAALSTARLAIGAGGVDESVYRAWREERPGAEEVAPNAWRVAAEMGYLAGDEDGWRVAAVALYNLGVSSQDRGDHEEALELYEEAYDAGRSSGTTEGLEVAAQAESNRAALLYMHTETDRALDAWKRAAEAGREAATEEGLEIAASCGASAAQRLQDKGDDVAARAAYEQVLSDGRHVLTPFARYSVATAQYGLGVFTREDQPAPARALLLNAAATGRALATPQGFALAAAAERDLALLWLAADSQHAALEAARRAVEAARAAEDEELIEAAEFLLGMLTDEPS